MKRSIVKKLVAGTVLVTAIIFSGLPTFAQSRSHQDERNRQENSKYTKRTKGYKHEDKRNYHAKSHKENRHHHDQYSKVRTRHYEGDHYHKGGRVVYYDDRGHKHAVRRYYKRHGHRCYAHPRYGDVVVRFSVRPTIINHCDGDFYYTRGRYYQYYPEVGYVRVEAPQSTCFEHIPDGCERVSYRGGVYFRLGDLSFVKDGRGFRIAGSIDL